MKINFILPFTNPTGGIRVVFEYANWLTNMGHNVVCYVPMLAYKFNKKSLPQLLKASIGNTVKRGTRVKWMNLNFSIKLVPCINNSFIRTADVTIATAWPTAYSVDKLDGKVGKKYYFIQHYETWSGPEDLVDGSYRLKLNHITIASWLKELMEKKFKAQNVSVVLNGNDLIVDKHFEKVINKPKRVLMMYSSLNWKGFEDGLKTFEEVKKNHKNLELVLFGNERGEGIPHYARFVEKPNRNQLKELYMTSDIFIFPSRFEGWGLTAIEAMACKCAVVGTAVGCMEDVGVHRKTVMLSEPQDINQMVVNLTELVENEELLRRISQEGYLKAITLTWINSAAKMENLLIR